MGVLMSPGKPDQLASEEGRGKAWLAFYCHMDRLGYAGQGNGRFMDSFFSQVD